MFRCLLNNLFLFHVGCMYVPTYKAIEHSPILDGHSIERLFDYSSEYFYFEGSDDVHATVASPFYEYAPMT